ncbi:MAG: alpha-L-glutamate ligase-like protein [bacterium]|nr:alpha-L-glutamate ligase-like protein [bacterium]
MRQAGVLGMNQRNFDYVQGFNDRRLYPVVDDKVRTKEMCAEAGVPTPETLAVVTQLHEIRSLETRLEREDAFVIKPARGSQGNGILVATDRCDDHWQRASGRPITREDLHFRVCEILSGLYSLSGQPDHALVEECLHVHPSLSQVVHGGVPDLRVIVFRRHPVMVMLRLPTRAADGRANLHQGAIGVGLSLIDGRPLGAVCESSPIEIHPDTNARLADIEVPDFAGLLRIATVAGTFSELGYVGVDLVLDAERGPVILELNARPGLAIQLANGAGLARRLSWLDEAIDESAPLEDRIDLARRAEIECRGRTRTSFSPACSSHVR